MNKILILANSASGLYDFRNELILELLKRYEVHISLPDGEKVPQLAQEGCKMYYTAIDRRGVNPARDLKLLCSYWKLIWHIKPKIVLTYTIKPNIYGNICCRLQRVPYIANITGLGSAFENGGIIQKIVTVLYQIALKNAACVFFQNKENQRIFAKSRICGKKSRLVPGSGVNLDRHCFKEYPLEEEHMIFLYVGRIMKEKGIDELLYAAKAIHKEYPKVLFQLVGNYEDDYKQKIESAQAEGVLELIGYQKNITSFYQKASAVVMPSYHEGMSNVILEAAANGRPVLATQIPGCREGFTEGVTGFGFPPKNQEALYDTIVRFLNLSYKERVQMGRCAREKMEREFDRKKVIQAYIEEIQSAGKEYKL
ncbi:N,N'-diacetylbacillosaminyl-diphospho-undecaprenol alpha-1,3-N-acetylgalactosaminyltransferase [Lachnospiraceae bacterium]|nr:N,N'-diacetylbacillosaminyl-diphospho-undecaprenol alpha-1,3-N-acetylgalactosaminyltransferase [Lachnospiraceae bacterium]